MWELDIPVAGDYVLWAEVHWEDAKGNSWYVSVDAGEPSVFGNDPRYQHWHWVQGGTYRLGKGAHTVQFRTREEGARVRRIRLTNDAGD